MVVEAGEVLKPFRASNKRAPPKATITRQRGPVLVPRTSVGQSLLSLPPFPAQWVQMVVLGWCPAVCRTLQF